jgi:hypothetical protein
LGFWLNQLVYKNLQEHSRFCASNGFLNQGPVWGSWSFSKSWVSEKLTNWLEKLLVWQLLVHEAELFGVLNFELLAVGLEGAGRIERLKCPLV